MRHVTPQQSREMHSHGSGGPTLSLASPTKPSASESAEERDLEQALLLSMQELSAREHAEAEAALARKHVVSTGAPSISDTAENDPIHAVLELSRQEEETRKLLRVREKEREDQAVLESRMEHSLEFTEVCRVSWWLA